MTGNGRRATKVSELLEYIAQLNTMPPPQDLESLENFNLDGNWDMYTNPQFFDFELGQDADLPPGSFDGKGGVTVAQDNIDIKPPGSDLPGEQMLENFALLYASL
jgi:hypothetical protein